jgi:hypothetical protein
MTDETNITTSRQIGRFEAEEKLRRIYEAFNKPNSSYWADNVLRTIRETMDGNAGLRVRGVSRVADEPRALLVMLNGIPTDDDLRSLHDFLRRMAAAGWRHRSKRNDAG